MPSPHVLHYILLVGLLLNQCHYDVLGFSVKLTQEDNIGFEGNVVDVIVRLVGQIFGEVDVQLELLILSEFEQRNLGTITDVTDAAEQEDFSYMGNLTHTFQATSEVTQDATFSINLFDDALNEREEKFVAVVTVTRIQNQEDDAEELSDRLYATVTIRVNPRAPDYTTLSVSAQAQTGSSVTVSEATTELPISLNITENPPENDIEISITTKLITSNPAMPTMDYNLPITSVNLTRMVTDYNITMEIINDDISEPEMEDVEVTFEVSSSGDMVTFSPASIIVRIKDDDVLTFGFTERELTIREGESSVAGVAILSPEEVVVSVTGMVQISSTDNSLQKERPDPMSFTLTPENRLHSFMIDIPSNDDTGPDERRYTLEIVSSAVGDLRVINPDKLTVLIKDNDTKINFGISPLQRTVQEGENFTFTVGFFAPENGPMLDDDFILGYSVKIEFGNATSSDFVTTDIADGVLANTQRSQDITLATKDNDVIETNRIFLVIIEYENTSLIKVTSGSKWNPMVVIILDDDIDRPNKPNISVLPLSGKKEFEVKWDIEINEKQPVASYRVEIRVPGDSSSPGVTKFEPIPDYRSTHTTYPYEIDGVDYSRTTIFVRVCAINRHNETCSDEVRHQGLIEQGEISPIGGISGGAIAGIIIAVIFLCCLLFVLLVIILYGKGYWRSYPPESEEEKMKQSTGLVRSEDDV